MVMDKEEIQRILEKALEEGRNVLYEGKVASYIPELAKANSGNLGVCLMRKDGSDTVPGIITSPSPCRAFPKPSP